MKLKHNVRFGNPVLAISFAKDVVNDAFKKFGYDFVVTSVNDSKHSNNSLHGLDMAFDARCKHIADEDIKFKILAEIKDSLTIDFDVLYEDRGGKNQHFHIEYDKK